MMDHDKKWQLSGKIQHDFVTHYRDKSGLSKGQKVNFRINSRYLRQISNLGHDYPI
jgi:hypothetical protein